MEIDEKTIGTPPNVAFMTMAEGERLREERDELKAFSERLETAAHDKLGVTLFGVDYVTEEFMLHVRDTLTAERDEWMRKAEQAERAMNKAAGKWAKSDDENRELHKMLLLDDGTVEEYTERADPLTALAYQKQLAKEWRDRCHNAETLCDKLESERDEWKAKAEARSAKRATAADGATNLEWLYEHDREKLLDLASKSTGCINKHLREWLMAPHMDAQRDNDGTCPNRDETASNHSKAQSKTEPTLSQLFGILSDESCRQYADQGEREEAHDGESDSREKLEADVEEWSYNSCAVFPKSRKNKIIGWLDRQAEITKRECDRQKINALRACYGAGPTTMTDEQLSEGKEVYVPKMHYDVVVLDEMQALKPSANDDSHIKWLENEIEEQRKVIRTQAESFRKLESEIAAMARERDRLAGIIEEWFA